MNNEVLLIRKLVIRLLRSWPVIIVALLLWSVLALFVLGVSPILFQSKVSIMVEEPYRIDDPQRWILGEQRFNEPGRAYIVNEGIRMKELSLVRKTCDSLNLGIRYLEQGILTDFEMYQDAPFEVRLDTISQELAIPTGIVFSLSLLEDGGYRVEAEGEYGPQEELLEIDEKVAKGASLQIAGIEISIQQKDGFSFDPENSYAFELVNTTALALELVDAIEIDAVQLESSIFTASITTSPAGKGKHILEVLSAFYVQKKLRERKRVLLTTLGTIKTEIVEIRDQLAMHESDIEEYKSKVEINSTEEEGKSLLERIASLELLRTDLQTRQEYLEYLNTSLTEASGNKSLVMPSAYGLSDQGLNQLVAEFNDLILKKKFYESEEQTKHPAYNILQTEVLAKAGIIGDAVQGFEASNTIRLSRLNNEIREVKKRSSELPFQQMELLRKDRSFHALDLNYRALNQRRVEVGIALASLSADVRVIEKAHDTSLDPIFPDTTLLALFIILLALGSPFIYLLAKTILGKNMLDIRDMEGSKTSHGQHIYTLRAGKALQHEQLITNNQSGNVHDLRKIAGSLAQMLSNGPKVISMELSGNDGTLKQDAESLLAQIGILGIPTLCVNFEQKDNNGSYKSFIERLETGESILPMFSEKHSGKGTVSTIDLSWSPSDYVRKGDKAALTKLFDQFELLVLLIDEGPQLVAKEQLEVLVDTKVKLIPCYSPLDESIKDDEIVVLTGLPPLPYQFKEWIGLLHKEALGIVGVSKMLFNRI